MRLQQLLVGVGCKIYGNDDVEVTSLCCDTSKVSRGCLFFCLNGKNYDGHEMIVKALGDGAVGVVCERKLDTEALQIVVPSSRSAMAICAKNFNDCVADKMKIVSIVGTNGKTSTSYILNAILCRHGIDCGVIGTNGVFFGGKKYSSSLTTPDPIELHNWLKLMYLAKVRSVIVEVSAHAIALSKMSGICAEAAIFTNFSQDHLDYFGTMQKYAEVKKSYFCRDYVRNAVVNVDDELGKQIAVDCPCVTYSAKGDADVFAENVKVTEDSIIFILNAFGQKAVIKSRLGGLFNVYNILAAAACAVAMGIPMEIVAAAVSELDKIDGRNEKYVLPNGAKIIVDYAHTPDGIDNVLSYLRDNCNGKLIVVFGCGGNRDKFKRPLMAKAVSKYADFAVITNDNPRYEDPKTIAEDILYGMSCPCKVVLNRKQATEYAASVAESNDVVAVLGKGAERYQEVRNKKLPYSDSDTVLELINR